MSLVKDSVLKGQEGHLNVVTWRSGTIERVCAGSLAAEANAMAAACHQCEWVQNALCEVTNALYDPVIRRCRLFDWEASSGQKPFTPTIRGVLVFRSDVDAKLYQNICITDAKSLYDALERDSLKAKEKQVALVTAEIKQVMAVVGLRPRWMPHNHMAVDGLTTDMKKSNLRPLLTLMKTGKIKLTAETEEMDSRTEVKESGGRIARNMGK